MKQCPQCHRTFDDRLAFCQVDGTPLAPMGAGLPVTPPRPGGPPNPPARPRAVPPPPPVPGAAPVPDAAPPVPSDAANAPPPDAAPAPGVPLATVAVGAVMLAVLVGGGAYVLLHDRAPVEAAASEAVASAPASPAPAVVEGPQAPQTPSALRYADAPGDGFVALRSAPSIREGSRLGTVPHGQAVSLLNADGPGDVIEGRSGQWVQVQYGQTVGWAFSAFLRTPEDEALPPGTVAQNTWATVYEPRDGWLNLRSGPQARTDILTRMNNGERVYVRYCRTARVQSPGGQPGHWCLLDYNGLSGWAFDAFLVYQ